MNQRITAIVENGLLRPTTPLGLADGTRVELLVVPAFEAPPAGTPRKSPAEILAKIAAIQEDCPDPDPDPHTARDHDHYLYGAPRRT